MKIFDNDVTDSDDVTWQRSRKYSGEVAKMTANRDEAKIDKKQCGRIILDYHFADSKKKNCDTTESEKLEKDQGDQIPDKISPKIICEVGVTDEQIELERCAQINSTQTSESHQCDKIGQTKPGLVSKFETLVFPKAIDEMEAGNEIVAKCSTITPSEVINEECDKICPNADCEENIVTTSKAKNQKQCDEVGPPKRNAESLEVLDSLEISKQCVSVATRSSDAAGVIQTKQCEPFDGAEEMELCLNDKAQQCDKIEAFIESGRVESGRSAHESRDDDDIKKGGSVEREAKENEVCQMGLILTQDPIPELCDVPMLEPNEDLPQVRVLLLTLESRCIPVVLEYVLVSRTMSKHYIINKELQSRSMLAFM